MALALTIFLFVLLNEIITWIGKSVLQEYAFAAHQRMFNGKLIQQQRALQKELLDTKAQLLRTSAQDEFAKWAKLRRKVDKGLSDLEKLNSQIASSRTGFSIKFSSALWISTTGTQFVIGWYYRRSAVFWVPKGWFGPLEYWLAFPFAPAGSVSCGIWQMSCKRVIKMGEKVVKETIFPPKPEGVPQENENVDKKKQ